MYNLARSIGHQLAIAVVAYSKWGDAMRRDLMDILACPVCKGKLDLRVEEENEREIVKGSLYCGKCDEVYPIVDGIPNLLPPSMRKAKA